MKLYIKAENSVKVAQGICPCGAFVCEILVKFSVFGPNPNPGPIGVKFGVVESTEDRLPHAKFHPNRCNVSLRGAKTSKSPQNKRNTGAELRAMLPVIKNNFFAPSVARSLTATKLGTVILAPSKHVLISDAWFRRYWVLKIRGNEHTHKLKPPQLRNPLCESTQILTHDPTWSYLQMVKIWSKSPKGYTPVGLLYAEILVKRLVSGPHTPLLCQWGLNLAWRSRLLHVRSSCHRCNVSPLWGEKPQNRPE